MQQSKTIKAIQNFSSVMKIIQKQAKILRVWKYVLSKYGLKNNDYPLLQGLCKFFPRNVQLAIKKLKFKKSVICCLE